MNFYNASRVGGMLAGFLQSLPEENKNEISYYYYS